MANEERTKIREFRRVISSAVQVLREQASTRTYAAITLDELLQRQKVYLQTGTHTQLSRMQRIDQVYKDMKTNLEAIKATPPEAFRVHSPSEDVNTAP